MRLRVDITIAAASLSLAVPAQAEPRPPLNLPAGSLKEALAALAAQTGASVGVADPTLWHTRVRAIRGRYSVQQALDLLTRGSAVRAAPIDGSGWRIVRIAARAPAIAVKPVIPTTTYDRDIVVTASKRGTRLGAYQGTATVIGGASLDADGPAGTEAIAARLASITSTHLGAGRNKLFVRGIADSSFTGPTQATVGQYVDDLRLTYNAPDPNLRLYDIAAVEVLEGPQGTLYGAGSLGGIVRVVRNAPRLDRIEAASGLGLATTAHGDPSGDTATMLNLPLVGERLAVRAVGYASREGGWIDDVARGLDDVNRVRTVGGRIMFRAAPGDGWTIDAGGTVQDIDGADSQYADRDAPPLTRRSRIAQGFGDEYRLGELTVSREWGDWRFVSSNGIVRQRVAERFDASAEGAPLREFRQWNRTRMLSTENRLSRAMRDGFGGVVGISFIRNEARLTRVLGDPADPMPVTGVRNRIEEATLYGEASVEPVAGLVLTAGARATRSWLSGEGLDVARALVLADRRVQGGRRETTVLPSASASVTPVDGLILFARYQEGFRPGGLAVDSDFVRRFRNDRVATLESGIRYDGGRIALAATMAHTRWRNIQADFIDGNGLPTTANIGDGRIYSFDAKAAWMPADGLTIEASAVLNDSKVTEPEPTFRLATMARLPNVAQFGARAGAEYRAQLTETTDLLVAGWGRYVGRSRLGVGPVLGALQGDYLDTGLSARIGRPGFGVTLGVTNLFDTVGNRFALGTPFDVGAGDEITPLRPRTVRIGIDTRF